MKKILSVLVAAGVCSVPAIAQMGGSGPGGGSFDNGMEKLFGANPVFSATMLTSISGPQGPMTVKAKMVFDHNNSWTEVNMADVQSANLPPQAVQAAAQMKAIGMDDVVSITTADKKNAYMIYPRIHSYVDIAIPSSAQAGDFNAQTTKMGEETVNGHSCIKNDVIITNSVQSSDFTVWNATDLNNFPVRIVTTEQGMPVTINFQDVSFDRPAAGLFDPPAHFTRYGTIQDLMQSALMNRPGGMPGTPSSPASPGP
ncbi:MAG TPA: hypothetical protein VNV43_03940 [Candidatus Acidoferrales bacterium]|jgi:hypothetical protein|nr:hypothetical protein [Candidatus Acidoferrales bacterium]